MLFPKTVGLLSLAVVGGSAGGVCLDQAGVGRIPLFPVGPTHAEVWHLLARWQSKGRPVEKDSVVEKTLDHYGLLVAGVLARAVWAWVSMGSRSSEGILGLVTKHLPF